jgi:hypothetical protein
MLFWGIWAPPNGPKKMDKDPQVGWMYGLMLELKYLTYSMIRCSLTLLFGLLKPYEGHLGTLQPKQ